MPPQEKYTVDIAITRAHTSQTTSLASDAEYATAKKTILDFLQTQAGTLSEPAYPGRHLEDMRWPVEHILTVSRNDVMGTDLSPKTATSFSEHPKIAFPYCNLIGSKRYEDGSVRTRGRTTKYILSDVSELIKGENGLVQVVYSLKTKASLEDLRKKYAHLPLLHSHGVESDKQQEDDGGDDGYNKWFAEKSLADAAMDEFHSHA